MQPIIDRHLNAWGEQQTLHFYPAIKALLLDINSHIFCGFAPGDRRITVFNQAFLDMQTGMHSLIKKPWPGTPYQRGIEARKRLQQLLQQQLADHHLHTGDHVIGHLCRHRSLNGNRLSDQAIIDHLIFLLLAAHNAVTSLLTMSMLELVKHPRYQQQLRYEAKHFDRHNPHGDGSLLSACSRPLLDQVFNETLRLYPPVPQILRRSICDTELNGYFIPANTLVQCSPMYTQRMEQYWPAPEQFDPERFSQSRQQHLAHPHLWQPFGAGPHQCMGKYFAVLLYQGIMTKLLLRFEFAPATARATACKLQYFPCVKPLNHLPLRLEPAYE
jgi:cytochrome P450